MTQTKEDLAKMTLVELKAALKALGQPVSGKKDELVERLLAAQQGAGTEDAAPEATAPAEAAAPAPAAASDPEPAPVAAAEDTATVEEKPSKHARIVFSEEAVQAAPAKVVVVKPAGDAAEPAGKSDADKMKDRSDRFKDPDVEKAKQRALRFGTYNADLEKERAKKRAERFGTFNPELELEKKAKRAERFGVDDPESKLALRAARFGISNPAPATKGSGTAAPAKGGAAKAGGAAKPNSEFEKAKQARAERFGLKA